MASLGLINKRGSNEVIGHSSQMHLEIIRFGMKKPVEDEGRGFWR